MPSRVPPARIVRVIERFRHRLNRIHRRSVPAPVALLEMIFTAWSAQGLVVACQLHVADALADGPLTIDELAKRVGADPAALGRLLRALIGEGIFTQTRDGRYALNAMAEPLRSDAEVSVAAMARFVGSRQHREHWSHLVDAIRTGEPVVPTLRGMDTFEYFTAEPELGQVFNEAMTSISEFALAPTISAYDFTPFPTIVDVGGGHGRLLSAVLGTSPQATGVLYDRPEVVASAPELLSRYGVRDRVQILSGSFFEGAPTGGDLYILKNIIHDWPDASALNILQNIRVAAERGATLLLVETVIPDHDREFAGKWTDMEMLLTLGACERTAGEYQTLLKRAGFQMTRVVPTASPFSLVEAKVE
ncbi:methyltransferase [Mycobacterium sp. D16R24]|uniref:methyltransferase n=1 Tax=Mycobacterium sp. D16R24 TaxID=1855656 RepID=UPI0009928484|nr:methyltransferase [Mycobacterium sp. D16R24]